MYPARIKAGILSLPFALRNLASSAVDEKVVKSFEDATGLVLHASAPSYEILESEYTVVLRLSLFPRDGGLESERSAVHDTGILALRVMNI
jgi:hypothetical protein